MLRAVCFDAGETLFRLRRSVGEIYAEHASRQGISIEPARLEERFGSVFRTAPPLAFPDAASSELTSLEVDWWRRIVRQVFDDVSFADFESFFRELFDYFADAEVWQLFDDTLPTLAALKQQGLKIAVVSNFDSRLFAICSGLGIARYADTIVASSRAGAAKPDPKIFRIALDRLGVEPGNALHVGDSLNEDVRGAQAAGLRALLLARKSLDDTGGDALRDLRQVCDLVGRASPIKT